MLGNAARTWATLGAKKKEEKKATEETPEPSRKKFAKVPEGASPREVAGDEKHYGTTFTAEIAPAV